jgi:pimeloyl-ACP methyl ester carboxylesterase
VRVHRVEFDDLYVRVSTAGPERDRGFVLIPGIGVSSNYFERLALELHEFGPVHALDLPGFGGVPHRRRRMTIRDYADLVAYVINELDLGDPVLIGHSMGAQIVVDMAARCRRPTGEPFSHVVLISPVINRRERRLRTAAWRFLQASLREPPAVAAVAAYAYLLCGPRWFWRVLPEMMTYPIEDLLPEVPSSTLVLTGKEDPLCPRSWTGEICELLPHGRAYEIAGAAHSVMHANAADVARLCIRHARGDSTDEDEIEVIEHPVRPGSAKVGSMLRKVVARATELLGIVSDDDRKIARGKTLHTEAEGDTEPEQDAEADGQARVPGESGP